MLKTILYYYFTLMDNLINKLDENLTNNYESIKNFGENDHPQESWVSNCYGDLFNKLYFQLTRQSNNKVDINIITNYEYLINEGINTNNEFLIKILISLLFQTRDILCGKGEYNLFYNILPIWNKYWHKINNTYLKKPLLLLFDTKAINNNYIYHFSHPYGSWKDIKYIFNSFRLNLNLNKEGIISECKKEGILSYIIFIIKKEWEIDNSMMFKWLPREKSKKFGWQVGIFANCLFPNLLQEAKSLYRKRCSKENIKLETIQINQCNHTWSYINFNQKCTSLTTSRQFKSFMNKGSNNLYNNNDDRLTCKFKFQNYLCNHLSNSSVKNLSLGEIVKKMIHLINLNDQELINYYNLIWDKKLSEDQIIFNNVIPVLDLSLSMISENTCYYDALGIALWIACKSENKRILTFNNETRWLNLENLDNLSSILEKFKENKISHGSNLYKSLKLIIDVCIINNISNDEIENKKLIILSDMQVNKIEADENNFIMQENIDYMFGVGGLNRQNQIPFKSPTIIFWNMKLTNGFPSLSNIKNVFMISGVNHRLIFNIIKDGRSNIKDFNSRDSIIKYFISNKRYNWFWK